MNCAGREVNANRLYPVTLQLKWSHQFQFAGYYMALHNGHYQRAGLDVRILAGDPDVNVTEEVLAGKADFGIGSSELLLDYAKGNPVQVLGVIFQHSPLAVVIPPVETGNPVQALAGGIVMMDSHSGNILAMLRHMGLTDSQWTRVDHSGDVNDFINSKVDAYSIYLSNEPWLLKKKGVDYQVLYPRSYGIDFYGDNFFTRRQMVEEHEPIVKAFCIATRAGWEDVLKSPSEAVNLILEEYPCSKKREHLSFEAERTLNLMTSLVYPGYMLPARWDHIARTYVEVGMLDQVPDLTEFLYLPEQVVIPHWIFDVIVTSAVLLLLLSSILLYIRNRNMILEREIEMRDVAETQKEHREYQKRLKRQQLLIRDIHDGLGGIIANLSFSANLAYRERDLGKKNNLIENLEKLATEVNTEVRDLMNSLEGTTVNWGDIKDSIRRSAEVILGIRQIDVGLDFRGLSVSEKIGLFEGMSLVRIIREAMNNIAKHSGASKAKIMLQASEEEINITIGDDGCGFDPGIVRRGRGLGNITRRVAEFNGSFALNSTKGTSLTIVIPRPIRIVEDSTTLQGDNRNESDNC